MVVLAIGGGITAALVTNRKANQPSVTGVQTFRETSKHVTGTVNYPQSPPAGGGHNQVWLNCGMYDKPVPSENAVHDLEHGAVWITYRPKLPASQVDALRQMVPGETYLALSPSPNLPAPVVASAWGAQLRLTSVGDRRLTEFIQRYRQSSQAPEPGAPCTGGTGTPLQ